jgi:Ner family transcriptional regulator
MKAARSPVIVMPVGPVRSGSLWRDLCRSPLMMPTLLGQITDHFGAFRRSYRQYPAQDSLERMAMKTTNCPEGNVPVAADWHPADVLAALKKRGHTLAGLSVTNGYHPTAAGKALKQSWPALERLLADAIGVPQQQIWPSRYDSAGNPRRRAKT